MMPAVRKYLIAVALVTACGSEPSTPADPDAARGEPDAAVEPDAPIPGDEIEVYLRQAVAHLSETPRSTNPQRDATRAWLIDELTAAGLEPALHTYSTGANVIARVEATGGGDAPAIVLGAHFDGVTNSPAAADDGTGTALVLALARWLTTLPARDQPVILALFDQEEIGLVGSTRYAQQLVADGTAIDAVHIFDMISYDGDGDGVVELWSPSPALATAYQAAAGPLGIPVSPVAFEFSDHQSFLDQGFVATGVGEEFVGGDHTPDYHQPTDTYDKINFTYLRRIADLLMAVIETELTE